jgi:hypothetical protein
MLTMPSAEGKKPPRRKRLRVGQVALEVLLRGDVGPEVAALGSVKPGWVVLARNGRDEGIDDRGQSLALGSVEFEAHGGDLSWSVGYRDDRTALGELH